LIVVCIMILHFFPDHRVSWNMLSPWSRFYSKRFVKESQDCLHFQCMQSVRSRKCFPCILHQQSENCSNLYSKLPIIHPYQEWGMPITWETQYKAKQHVFTFILRGSLPRQHSRLMGSRSWMHVVWHNHTFD
jgi:hypothetical protein